MSPKFKTCDSLSAIESNFTRFTSDYVFSWTFQSENRRKKKHENISSVNLSNEIKYTQFKLK